MLLDRRRVKFWQRWVFLVMAVLMGGWLVSIPIGRAAGCNDNASSGGSDLNAQITTLQAQTTAAPKDAAAWLQLAEALQSRANTPGRDDTARAADLGAAASAYEKYDKLLAKKKGAETKADRIAALEMLGTVYSELQDYQAAVGVYGRLTDLKPKDADYYFSMGSIAVNAGDTNTALLAFDRFLELAPDAPEAETVRQWLDENAPKGSAQ